MTVKILAPADLGIVSPDSVVTMLFGYKRRLLEAARDYKSDRQIIFDEREKIAGVFRQFGGERHQQSAELFEGLTNPDDLLEYAPANNDLGNL